MESFERKKENSNSEFIQLLASLRKDSENAPTPEEISREIELIRKARYEK